MTNIGAQLIQPDLALAWFMMSIQSYNLDNQTKEALERVYVGSLYLGTAQGTEPVDKEAWMTSVMTQAMGRGQRVLEIAQEYMKDASDEPDGKPEPQ